MVSNLTARQESSITLNTAGKVYQVHLAIYDLSHGIAKTLSAQLLGPCHAIDAVPHTSILAFGKEYYFGSSGVEQTDPHHFRSTRQLFPIETLDLGETEVCQEEFEEWCNKNVQSGLYASHSYDLFHRNCNDFSHHAATEGLRLKKAVPQWVLEVPRRVLASPMGPLLRPMLEKMHIDPSGGANDSTLRDSSLLDERKCNIMTTANPRKSLAPSSSSSMNKKAKTEVDGISSKNHSIEESSVILRQKTKSVEVDTPILDSYNRPLLSKDNSMLQLHTEKLKTCFFASSDVTDTERERFLVYLDSIPQLWADRCDGTCDTNYHSGKVDVEMRDLLNTCNKLLVSKDGTNDAEKTVVLMFLRLLVVQKDIMDIDHTFITTLEVLNGIVSDQVTHSSSTRTMAWCALGDAIASIDLKLLDDHFLDTLVDSALISISSEREKNVNVRRGASAFLYNVVLVTRNDDADHAISDLCTRIVCEIFEVAIYEQDRTVACRMLLTVGKVVKHGKKLNTVAASLLKELGFRDTLTAMSKCLESDTGEDLVGLADEIMNILV